MLSTQALASWAVLVLAAIAPLVAERFELAPVLIGYQVAIVYFVATATSLVAGGLVGRWGACRVSQVCLLTSALGCLVLLLPALPTIALGSGLIGFAYGLTNPSAAHLLAKRTTLRNRSFVFSIKQTGVPVGGVAAGLLTPMIAVTWGWQAAVAVIIPVALLLAALLAPHREDWDADRDPRAPAGLRELRNVGRVFACPGLTWLSFCGFCFATIQLCLMTFIASFGITELAFSAILGGALLATVQGSGVAGRLTWGFVADRIQRNDVVLT
ncbi:MAG: MFS transporter, partial [Hyphomicrobiales bacterium]